MAVKGIKSVCVDVLVFFGVLTLIGHVSIDVWQRFVVNSELTSMKTSLNALKTTLNNILNAYDKLDKNLNSLKTAEKSALTKDLQSLQTSINYHQCKNVCDMKDMLKDKNLVKNKACSAKKKTHDLNYKNESTITRYPLQSKGIGPISRDLLDYMQTSKKYNHYKNYECDGQNCNSWKF